MDSICSAVGYAELKRRTGMRDVVAARAGNTNERIDYVLRRFGVEAPVLMTDLSPRVADVMEAAVSIAADASVYEAIQLIERRQMRGVPVVDGRLRCVGLFSAFEALNYLVPLRASPGEMARTLARRVKQRLGAVLAERDFVRFAPDTLLAEAREETALVSQVAFPVMDAEGRLAGVLSTGDFLKAIPRQLILVDHNELSQAAPGAGEVPIVEILDHHRMGGFSSDAPMLVWNNPVGSTSTIVAMCYEQQGVAVPEAVAGLLMAGVIADTLHLTSPTATPDDRRMLEWLAPIAGVESARLAEEIFSVGSPLRTLTAREAITADCKEYREAGVRFSVAQIEELSFAPFDARQEELQAALEAYCRENSYLFSALLVTDVNRQTSLLLLCGSEAFARRVDFPRRGPHLWVLDGVVSRKKQVLPYLLDRLHEMERK